jgi:hypothetical protein
VLTVNGSVTGPFKKGDIGHFLEHVKGVASLQNNLDVLPTSMFDDQIRRSIARAIYREPYFVNYGNQALAHYSHHREKWQRDPRGGGQFRDRQAMAEDATHPGVARRSRPAPGITRG